MIMTFSINSMKVILLGGLTIVALSCDSDKRAENGGAVSPQTSDSPQLPETDPSNFSNAAPKSMAECNSQGLAWIAVVDGGKSPAKCVGELAKWDCCEEMVLARFTSMAGQIEPAMDSIISSEGYKLYNCEKPSGDSARQTKLHFWKQDGNGKTEYKYLDIDSWENEPASPVSCPIVTTDSLTDPGGDTGEDAETEGDEEVVVE